MRRIILCIMFTPAFSIGCVDPKPAHRLSSRGATSQDQEQANCLKLNNAPTWSTSIGQIFEANCGSCHPGSQKTDYKTYSNVKLTIQTILTRIDSKSSPMPPTGQLTQRDRDAIHAWFDGGMLETDINADSTTNSDSSAAPTSNSNQEACIPQSTSNRNTNSNNSSEFDETDSTIVSPNSNNDQQ